MSNAMWPNVFGGSAAGTKGLYTQILPGLWQGGTAADDEDGLHPLSSYTESFDTVVTMYSRANPHKGLELRWSIPDADFSESEYENLILASEFAYHHWHNKNHKVLIRCQAGLNRSGLVTAAVLINYGYEADAAIELVRAMRSPYALFNQDFVRILRQW